MEAPHGCRPRWGYQGIWGVAFPGARLPDSPFRAGLCPVAPRIYWRLDTCPSSVPQAQQQASDLARPHSRRRPLPVMLLSQAAWPLRGSSVCPCVSAVFCQASPVSYLGTPLGSPISQPYGLSFTVLHGLPRPAEFYPNSLPFKAHGGQTPINHSS